MNDADRSFLLRCAAAILAFQALIYLIGVIACITFVSLRHGKDCPGLREDLASTFQLALTSVLSYLAGNNPRPPEPRP